MRPSYQTMDKDPRKHLVIINKSKTRMEGKTELVFHDSIGKVLESDYRNKIVDERN